MTILGRVWQWLKGNGQGLVAGLLVASLVWWAYTYVYKEYRNYQNLVKWAVQLDSCFALDPKIVAQNPNGICSRVRALQQEIAKYKVTPP